MTFIFIQNILEFQSLTSRKLITWPRALQFWRYTLVVNILDHDTLEIQNIEQQSLHNVAS